MDRARPESHLPRNSRRGAGGGTRRRHGGRGHYDRAMRVAFIAAECEPWAKTGGLADVVDALARALGQVGGPALDGPVDVFLPRYRGITIPSGAVRHSIHVPDPMAPGGASGVSIIDVEA